MSKAYLNIETYPNHSILKNIHINLDSSYSVAHNLFEKINPQLHSCNTVSYSFKVTLISDLPYYVVGMKSFGRASNFLLQSGYKILDELMVHLKNASN